MPQVPPRNHGPEDQGNPRPARGSELPLRYRRFLESLRELLLLIQGHPWPFLVAILAPIALRAVWNLS